MARLEQNPAAGGGGKSEAVSTASSQSQSVPDGRRLILPIGEIKIGSDRHRKDMGDLTELAQSMADIGLLQPIGVTPDRRLVLGERRLRAARDILGWQEIPATIIPIEEIARGEYHENVIRKNFSLSEMVAIKRSVEAGLAARVGRPPKQERRENAPAFTTGRTMDNAAAYLSKTTGRSITGRTLDKAEAIVKAAEAEPAKYGKLRADMDRSGRVEAPYRRLKNLRQAEVIRIEKPPLPGRGPYNVISLDVPWPFDPSDPDPEGDGRRPYPTMTLDAIKALPVASLASPNAILWLWTTNFHMRAAYEVLDAWGFRHVTTLTWDKGRIGRGRWLREQTEHCLMAVCGKPTVTLTNQTTLIRERAREHSRKPDAFYDLVEALCPAPRYAGLFERGPAPLNWDFHSDELIVADAQLAP
jgi:N6-adenosine-specific RNA methylase IME4